MDNINILVYFLYKQVMRKYVECNSCVRFWIYRKMCVSVIKQTVAKYIYFCQQSDKFKLSSNILDCI